MCTPKQLAATLRFVDRPMDMLVQDVLLANQTCQPVKRADSHPHYVCNQPGEPRQALPTIMSRPNSFAFRPGQPGSLLDKTDPTHPQYVEPSAAQREHALG